MTVQQVMPTATERERHSLDRLLARIRRCTVCASGLPLEPRPILQAGAGARILIASQAPGLKAHEAGIPFADASGERLRQWLGIPSAVFYDAEQVAILPMGFCYPGRGRGGDLPPGPECAEMWRDKLLRRLRRVELTLVIGRYAMDWHLPQATGSVTEIVSRWREFWPEVIPLPHPSPRNQPWFRRHPWFETELLPALRSRVSEVLQRSTDHSA